MHISRAYQRQSSNLASMLRLATETLWCEARSYSNCVVQSPSAWNGLKQVMYWMSESVLYSQKDGYCQVVQLDPQSTVTHIPYPFGVVCDTSFVPNATTILILTGLGQDLHLTGQ